jgi:hypothetical protein
MAFGPVKRTGSGGRSNTYIGAPVERVEDLRFLRGRGEYVVAGGREVARSILTQELL